MTNKPRVRVTTDGRVRVNDGFVNMAAQLGSGVGRDKAASASYTYVPMHQWALNTAYRVSWLARKVVRIMPEDSTRMWRTWQADNADISKVEKREKTLRLQKKVMQALTAARLYGGAALYIGCSVGDPSEVLNPEQVRRGGITHLTVLNRYRLVPGGLDYDFNSPTYLEPLWFNVMFGERVVSVHRSRLVFFRGNETPDVSDIGARTGDGFWGDSVLVTLLDTIKRYDGLSANVASLIYEANVDVLFIPRLMELLRLPNGEEQVVTYLKTVSAVKGTNGMLVLDGGDTSSTNSAGGVKYDRKSITFAGISDIWDRSMQEVAAAAECPMTRLWAQSPAGMNATGESDAQNYAQSVGTYQKNEVGPALEQFDEMLIRDALGDRPEEVYYEWASIYTPTDSQKTERADKVADVIKKVSDTSLINPEILQLTAITALVDTGGLPGLEAASLKFSLAPPDPLEDEGNDTDIDGDDPTPGGGVTLKDAEQPRAPKGASNGGQWVKAGGGGGSSGSGNGAAIMKALAAASSKKYDANAVAALTQKNKEDLSHYEKKVLAKYKKALSAELGASGSPVPKDGPKPAPKPQPAPKSDVQSPEAKFKADVGYDVKHFKGISEQDMTENLADPKFKAAITEYAKASGDTSIQAQLAGIEKSAAKHDVPTGKSAAQSAAEKVASKSYDADKVLSLTEKDPKELTHYEKKVLAKYKKALASEDTAPVATTKPPAAKGKDFKSATDTKAQEILAQAGKDKGHGMTAETVQKVLSGEWTPKADYQIAAAKEAAAKLQAAGYDVSGAKFQPPEPFNGKLSVGNAFGTPSLENETSFATTHSIVSHTVNQTEVTGKAKTTLTADEKAAVREYTGSVYKDINTPLRKGEKLTPQLETIAKNIDSAISKYSLPADATFVRGINKQAVTALIDGLGGNIGPGDVFKDPGFSSMTRKVPTARSFGGIYGSDTGSGYQIVIKAKKGSSILPVKALSKYASEDEFLPPRGSKFKVLSMDPVTRVIVTEIV